MSKDCQKTFPAFCSWLSISETEAFNLISGYDLENGKMLCKHIKSHYSTMEHEAFKRLKITYYRTSSMNNSENS